MLLAAVCCCCCTIHNMGGNPAPAAIQRAHLLSVDAGGCVPVAAVLLQEAASTQRLWQQLLIAEGELAGR